MTINFRDLSSLTTLTIITLLSKTTKIQLAPCLVKNLSFIAPVNQRKLFLWSIQWFLRLFWFWLNNTQSKGVETLTSFL